MENVVDQELLDLWEARQVPHWLLTTLQESKLSAPLPSRIRSGSYEARGSHFVDSAWLGILMEEEEPDYVEDAQANVHWMQSMQEELASVEKNNTWDVVDLPPSKKAIGTKWVLSRRQMVPLIGTRHGWLRRVMHSRKELIMRRLLLPHLG